MGSSLLLALGLLTGFHGVAPLSLCGGSSHVMSGFLICICSRGGSSQGKGNVSGSSLLVVGGSSPVFEGLLCHCGHGSCLVVMCNGYSSCGMRLLSSCTGGHFLVVVGGPRWGGSFL